MMKKIFLASALFLGAASHGEASIQDIQKKLARFPADSQARGKAVLLRQLGDAYYDAGQMQQAASAYQSALENKTDKALRRHIYLYLAKSFESSNRVDKAVDAYKQALAYDPKNWRRHRDLAHVYSEVKFYKEAVQSLQSAVKLNRHEPSLAYRLGAAWRKWGFYGYAEAELKKALELGHDANAVNRELSFVYEGMGQFGYASASFEKSITGAVSAGDAARLVYLSALAGNSVFTERGFELLKEAKVSPETLSFYRSLVRVSNDTPQGILALNSAVPDLKAAVDRLFADKAQ